MLKIVDRAVEIEDVGSFMLSKVVVDFVVVDETVLTSVVMAVSLVVAKVSVCLEVFRVVEKIVDSVVEAGDVGRSFISEVVVTVVASMVVASLLVDFNCVVEITVFSVLGIVVFDVDTEEVGVVEAKVVFVVFIASVVVSVAAAADVDSVARVETHPVTA